MHHSIPCTMGIQRHTQKVEIIINDFQAHCFAHLFSMTNYALPDVHIKTLSTHEAISILTYYSQKFNSSQ